MLLALLKITKTNFVSEFLQLFCRCLFAYVSIDNFDESKGPFILIALVAFGVAEPIRYPFYILKILEAVDNMVGRFFSHLRYNLFIIFYPLGALCDGLTSMYSSENMRQSGQYSIMMPNQYNLQFDYAYFVGVVLPTLYCFAFPVIYGQLLASRAKYYATKDGDDKKVDGKDNKGKAKKD